MLSVLQSVGRFDDLPTPPPAGGGLGSVPRQEDISNLGLGLYTEEVVTSGGEVPQNPVGRDVGGGVSPAKEKSKASETAAGPFVVCDSLFPVPAKVVAKIKAKEFVDMAEILRDNIELERRLMNEVMPSTTRLSRREVPDLLSWVVCFSMFASVVSSLDPGKTKQLWAYLATVVREARRHGGKGWQTYDSMFRQLAAGASTGDWSVLNASLYATTFIAQANGRGRTCQHCMETDHTSASCALAPPAKPSKRESGMEDRRVKRGKVPGACWAWNDGKCAHPYCRFKHVCSSCGAAEHREADCSKKGATTGSSGEGGGGQ